jgi:hypothetical protein
VSVLDGRLQALALAVKAKLAALGPAIGAVVTTGARNQPHEDTTATATRPGFAFLRYLVGTHTPDTAVQNQQDSIIYVEGSVPSVDQPHDNEFVGYRFNMTSKAYRTGTPRPSLDIKGMQGIAVSDGGGAKARGYRVTVASINGSTGILTGGMASAHRSGVIPVSWGGDGSTQWTSGVAGPYQFGDAGHVAQVGPGIEAAYRAEGFAGKERPKFGWFQGIGAQALMPESAVIQLHAGGNGDIIRIHNDENLTTKVARWERTGIMRAPAFRSNVDPITLADNASASFTLVKSSGFLMIQQENTSLAYAVIFYRSFPGALAAITLLSGSATVIGTGALPADDASAKMDVFITDDTLTIRNRLGATTNFSFTLL